jgi:GNAT superfamily N-acetyltransferase
MVVVRPYREQDREALRELVLQLHETMRPFDPDLSPGPQIIDAYFAQLLNRQKRSRGAIFVAEDDGRLVGHVCINGLMTALDRDERPDAYSFMVELYVDPAYRSKGIGALLVKEAESYARRLGAYKMELNVFAGNGPAIRFYERMGYKPRVIVMSKPLDGGG